MKKSEMKKEAIRVINYQFKECIRYANRPYNQYKYDMVDSVCNVLDGMLRAYNNVGLISDNVFESLQNIRINISCYHNVFGEIGKYGKEYKNEL